MQRREQARARDSDMRLISLPAMLFRLPFGFLIFFVPLALFWTYPVFTWAVEYVLSSSTSQGDTEVSKLVRNLFTPIAQLGQLVLSFVVVGFYFAGILIAYNLAVLINWLIVRYGPKTQHNAAAIPHRPQEPAHGNRLDNVKKIGIVLAGGGAKGAFQAGAMKAIYRFLAENNALHKVKVISATSIGSWNALFWLADLIKSENGWDKQSVHESWWRSISLRDLVAPSWWAPFCRNAFLTTVPWQKNFDEIFGQVPVREKIIRSDIHFYLTSSHVGSGRLECITNNTEARDLPRVLFNRLDAAALDPDAFLERVKFGLFASMDLPPLFPYVQMGDHFYEDGGVIDNLPVIFAAMESCDLIFVLALNSDFIAIPDRRSLFKRFMRVMNVRQGALERTSLKNQYLYNELAALRKYARVLEAKLNGAKIELTGNNFPETLHRALARKHEESRIFAVCPQRTFAERTIDTHELWKGKKAGLAFSVMYRQTRLVLENDFDPSEEQIIAALIDNGGIQWAFDF
jgi:NTE family protein